MKKASELSSQKGIYKTEGDRMQSVDEEGLMTGEVRSRLSTGERLGR